MRLGGGRAKQYQGDEESHYRDVGAGPLLSCPGFPTQGMLAVAAGMPALSSASAFCSALGLCGIMMVGKAGTSKSFLSLGTAPARAPQNLHAIRTDSGLILEWEEVIPEDPGEGPLGPYKLSWVQENGTQVREIVPSATPTVYPVLLRFRRALECPWRVWGSHRQLQGIPSTLWQGKLPVSLVCLLWDSPVATLYANQEACLSLQGGRGAAGIQIRRCPQFQLYFLSSSCSMRFVYVSERPLPFSPGQECGDSVAPNTHCAPKVL